MAEIVFDMSELYAEADRLASAAARALAELRPSVTEAASRVESQLKAEASRSKSFKRIAGSINFEQKVTANSAEAIVGPRKSGAGNLANIAYFGGGAWAHPTGKRGWQQGPGGGGTLPDPQEALDAEAKGFEQSVSDALERLLS